MSSTVFANAKVAVSKERGAAVPVFPDVCKTPSPGGPVPTPYPNIVAAQKPGSKVSQSGVTVKSGSVVNAVAGNEAGTLKGVVSANTMVVPQLKSTLALLHTQLSALQGTAPERWHKLLDAYVMTTAQLYIALATKHS